MTDAQIKARLEALIGPYVVAFCGAAASFTARVAGGKAIGSLSCTQADADRLIIDNLKPHFSAVFNRLAEELGQTGDGVVLAVRP